MHEPNNLIDKVVSLCKRRGFVYPGSEIYGGLANSWDYGPLGVELKNNIKNLWWKMFVHDRDDMVGLDAALIMNPKVWEASGHIKNFSDPLVECKKCHLRFRADHVNEVKDRNAGMTAMDFVSLPDDEKSILVCKDSKTNEHEWTETKVFNLMLKTHLGPSEEKTNEVYFRPETAQAIFVQFKNILGTSRMKPPFGVAQIGKAFRNEITPGNFIFRTREFEQMEIEYFIPAPTIDADWQKTFEEWKDAMWAWIDALGISRANVEAVEISDTDRAFYSKRTIDFEYKYPFGQKELYGLAYRTDYDLAQHEKFSGENLHYKDVNTGENYLPHVIEPSLGVDRSFLAVLLDAYHEEGEGDKQRVVLKLKPVLAPYKVAVFPLLKNKPELVEKAREIYTMLAHSTNSGHAIGPIAWDDRGNIG
ncbi:MAG: glycine--tRNA ligase, partial [Patescibacteria group bacterium]